MSSMDVQHVQYMYICTCTITQHGSKSPGKSLDTHPLLPPTSYGHLWSTHTYIVHVPSCPSIRGWHSNWGCPRTIHGHTPIPTHTCTHPQLLCHPRILGHEGTCMCGYRCVSMDGPWTSPVTVPSTDTRTRGYMYVWV